MPNYKLYSGKMIYRCACSNVKPLNKDSSYNKKQQSNKMRISQILKRRGK